LGTDRSGQQRLEREKLEITEAELRKREAGTGENQTGGTRVGAGGAVLGAPFVVDDFDDLDMGAASDSTPFTLSNPSDDTDSYIDTSETQDQNSVWAAHNAYLNSILCEDDWSLLLLILTATLFPRIHTCSDISTIAGMPTPSKAVAASAVFDLDDISHGIVPLAFLISSWVIPTTSSTFDHPRRIGRLKIGVSALCLSSICCP
jgi:hypothetical protein